MRLTVLDTETTGFDQSTDKIVEIGAVEIVDRLPTGRTFHVYCNPGIPVPPAATDVHGLTDAFLADKPAFQLVAADFIAFVGADPIVAHNAPFDVGFLSAELGGPPPNEIIDTLSLARERHPGAPNSLDALCRRYGVSTARRAKHGALVDAELLAEVYIRLTTQQTAFDLAAPVAATIEKTRHISRIRQLSSRLSAAEINAHAEMISSIPSAIWSDY